MQKISLSLLEAALNQINLMYCCVSGLLWNVHCIMMGIGIPARRRLKEVIPFKQIGKGQDSRPIMSHKYILH